ncbi:hypothetical protein [Paenibacillus alvei]|uniref:hypothetical protein n=1 Tax=Paenibacillus alvei TaxID=44250 RepID=UPI0018CE8E00|nr:hypothetical protein [Paenibacillus alvei]MBG9733853.1 hypothetical protein [Paenibacillus alvei]MBG9743828.1 hypothetical protein [Paenibacillus alvei]MCY9580295.1 hypothetical protein [Paenibacillus alvei]MCY9583379.1 hypothetical protein [Paenibacillus alvei]
MQRHFFARRKKYELKKSPMLLPELPEQIFGAVSNGNMPIALDEVGSHPDTTAVGRLNRKS